MARNLGLGRELVLVLLALPACGRLLGMTDLVLELDAGSEPGATGDADAWRAEGSVDDGDIPTADVGVVDEDVRSADGNGGATDATTDDGAPAELYANTVLADRPVAYYRLDDVPTTVAKDATQNHLDGTYGSSIAAGPGLVRGTANGAAVFPGGALSVNKLVRVPRNAKFEASTAFTIECWLKFPAAQNGYANIVSYGQNTTSPYQPWVLLLANARFELYSAGGGSLLTGTTAVANITYHFVGRMSGTALDVWVNGTQIGSTTGGGTVTNYDATNGLSLGGGFSGTGTDPAFGGTLDEVAFYSYALSSAQIARHYQVGLGNP